MKESFLHFVWRTRRFNTLNLCTTDQQAIEIQHFGEYNTNAGPDFLNARLRIGDTFWAGNIEMHVFSSEWIAHRHQEDPAYENVVLHVVLKEDKPIFRNNGTNIPCLILDDRIPPKILENYESLENAQSWIPCEQFIQKVPAIIQLNWLDRVLIDRLELKIELIKTALFATENHWEEAFYRLLARNFGLKVNADPFEALARSLPLNILAKHKSNPLQLEALFFGQAGFLEASFGEDWPKLLAREYRHLANKYSLTPMERSQWKFLRMRPSGFPTIRLAQFASLIHHSDHLFSKLLETNNLREIEHLFHIQPSDYWKNHFQFDKVSKGTEKSLSKDFIHLIVINTIVPFMFHYGKIREIPQVQKRALEFLEALPPESNHILDVWGKLGVSARNAYQSQALIHLKTRYCDQKKCLECGIGTSILK